VGAFIGSSSLVFSRLVGAKGRVVAFEPNPFNLKRLNMILQKNPKYGEKVSVFPYALSDSNTNIKMVLSEEIDNGYSSTSRLQGSHSTINDGNLPNGFREFVVEAKTLDSFVAENNISPDILKVDIEGAEYEFLLGSVETIRKVHPTFYIELHSQYCAAKCTELLIKEGYEINIIHEEDDNRIMVLAEFVDSSKGGADVDKLKLSNNAFMALKNVSDTLSSLRKDMQIKGQEISRLLRENTELKIENKRLQEVESNNVALVNKLNYIESSMSWVITKPLRKVKSTLKARKK
jgi:FkbM family methyltransferase